MALYKYIVFENFDIGTNAIKKIRDDFFTGTIYYNSFGSVISHYDEADERAYSYLPEKYANHVADMGVIYEEIPEEFIRSQEEEK